MDTLAEKLGLYDVIGVFCAGVIALVSMELLLPFNLIDYIVKYEESFVNIVVFLTVPYILGLLLQESSSLIDRKLIKIRETPKQVYLLENNKILYNAVDIEIYKKLLIKTLNKSYDKNDKDEIGKDKMASFYYHCSSVLEINNIDGKVKRISAIYGLSRSLSLFYLVFWVYLLATKISYWYVALILNVLFAIRTYRFAAFKVRVVLRHYKAFIENK